MKPLMSLGVVTMLLSLQAGAQPVYKCEENGKVTYTDRPCSPQAREAVLPDLIVTPPPSRTERELARSHDARLARENDERGRDDAAWLKQHRQRRDREERVRRAIIEHKVIKSMTQDEVKQALGKPDRIESGESYGTSKETWLYESGGKTRRVNFKDGEVTTTSMAASRAPRPGHDRVRSGDSGRRRK